ncbi:MAG: HlyD family efflux transporter periplasmic adaptor subunit [Opitutales bacterium]
MKNKKYILALITLALSFRALIASPTCGHDHGAAPSAENAALSLRVQASKEAYASLKLKDEKAEKRQISKNVQALGQIENIPECTYEISSRIDGKVVELYVALGDVVKKGQSIARIESLLAGDPPPSVILVSPSDGVIESLEITNGSPIQANTSLARIVNSKKIYAIANVFEDDFASIEIGQIASIKIPALADKVYSAKVKKFATTANSATKNIGVFFEVDNESLALKQNMRATFSIEISKEEECLVVPNSAIGGNFPNHYVFVQECADDLIYEKIEVAIGEKDDNFTQILMGLKEGNIVACNNIYQLQFLPAASGEHHEHSADDFVPVAVTHTHCDDEHEHSFKEKCLELFIDFKNYMASITQSKYFNTVIYIALAISLLLNLFFIRSEFYSKKDGGKD